ncbi:PREDICTED: RNA-binding motif, single-stranded-interacting protein 1-like [Amphimedon queenslandica]|uniref:RRM domain-containing protein n=2 Tax=Amphimedon queenslandica TaxID=400682 RepID=A0AAN0JQ63_AMPQE|nr:PREDICTED: RNA-binding motif, single-stranded-interacting protein 1-like [Amphimedon queenslandica]|eukprot:XP_019858957.1 PREDICTED: RNA-binding motif, single-stranded-interacting protein 1-like [Amphimedon queenslandica]
MSSSPVGNTSSAHQEGEGLSETAASPRGAASLTAIPSESVSIEGAVTKEEETPVAKEGGHVKEETTAANGGEAAIEEEEDDKDDGAVQPQSPTSTESSSSNITSSITSHSSSSSFSNASNSIKVPKRVRAPYSKPLHVPVPSPSLPMMFHSMPTLQPQYIAPNPYNYYYQQQTPALAVPGLFNGGVGPLPIHELPEDDEPPKSTSNLYIRGLSDNCTDEDLRKMCEKYGTINSTKSILDKKTGQCKGYGFVDFSEEADALKALESLQAIGTDVQFARRQEEDPTNLYLSNLPKYYSEKDLEKLLSPYGRIISTRVLREPSGYSRGVGFVRLDSRENCEKAREALNNTIFPGTDLELNIKFADSGNYKRKIAYWKETEANAWMRDYLPPGSEYVYDQSPTQSLHPATVLSQNNLPTSRMIQQAATLNGNHHPQYIPQVAGGGYQTTSSSSPWHSYYATQPPTAVVVSPLYVL